MGNCLSANDPASLSELVARPGAPPEIQMTADTIRSGLTNVAAALNSKKQNISIIAVGGAVNTLLLHTRESTGDVDFFYRTKTKHEDVTQVIIAANTAATKLKLGDHWLNNHTALFIQVGERLGRYGGVYINSFFYYKKIVGGHDPGTVRRSGSAERGCLHCTWIDSLCGTVALCLVHKTGPPVKDWRSTV